MHGHHETAKGTKKGKTMFDLSWRGFVVPS